MTETKTAPTLHSVRFPNESVEFREARNELLMAERDLRRQVEKVAAMRRHLPLGGVVPQDYVFERAGAAAQDRGPVKLSELFKNHDSLIIYSFMFSSAMENACPSCTSILDAVDGTVPHLIQQTSFAVVAKSPAERIRGFAVQRGWRHLPLLSSAGNSYNVDYHAENSDGGQIPTANVFVRKNGQIYHSYGVELQFTPTEEGQNDRHVDAFWPLWNLLDLTPNGRGTDWYPKLSY